MNLLRAIHTTTTYMKDMCEFMKILSLSRGKAGCKLARVWIMQGYM